MARRTVEEVRAEIQAECRSVGITAGKVTDDELRARRREIKVSVVGVGIGIALLTIAGFRGDGGLASPLVRISLVLLGGFLAVYALQKRKHLIRIYELRAELGELQSRDGQRVIEHVVYSELSDDLRRSLVVEDTLDGLLDSAVELLGAQAGVLYVVRSGGDPSVWSRHGSPQIDRGPTSIAASVARQSNAELMDGSGRPVDAGGSRMASALQYDGRVVGVIEVQASSTTFDSVDLELLSRFCVSAQGALDGSVLVAAALSDDAEAPAVGSGRSLEFVSDSEEYF